TLQGKLLVVYGCESLLDSLCLLLLLAHFQYHKGITQPIGIYVLYKQCPGVPAARSPFASTTLTSNWSSLSSSWRCIDPRSVCLSLSVSFSLSFFPNLCSIDDQVR